jgi:hypothetical protein
MTAEHMTAAQPALHRLLLPQTMVGLVLQKVAPPQQINILMG